MSDDWRLPIDRNERGHARRLIERLERNELEHDLDASFQDRAVVSRDGAEVSCHAGTCQQAEHSEQLIRPLAAEHCWPLERERKHRHPSAEDS
ncbi:MAG: hypothetical protein WBP81_24055 [Solirubrobacteraceae bacterium]